MHNVIARKHRQRNLGEALYQVNRNLERAETVAGQIKSAPDEGTLARAVARWEQLTRTKWWGWGGKVDDASQA